MNEGDVILAYLPQADGRWKIRPAVYLREMRPFGDMLVCGVSSQLRHEVAGFDEMISIDDSDFRSSGLSEESLIRLGYLAIVSTKDFAGSLGSISAERHRRLVERLAKYLVN